MSPHGNNSRAELADVSAQEQQVYDLLHILGAAKVLSYPHAIAGHDTIGFKVNLRHLFELRARETRLLLDCRPWGCPQVCAQRLEAGCVSFNEVDIQHARLILAKRMIVGFDGGLHHSLEGGYIATNPQLVIVRGDRRRSHGRHLERSLRALKAFERPLAQWIKDNDSSATARCVV